MGLVETQMAEMILVEFAIARPVNGPIWNLVLDAAEQSIQIDPLAVVEDQQRPGDLPVDDFLNLINLE